MIGKDAEPLRAPRLVEASILAVAAAAAGCIPDAPPPPLPPGAPLPPGCGLAPGRAAVSLTYDDALASQLDDAVPDLDRHGLLGTFFLTDTRANPAPWRALRARGHELAAHTFAHPCARSNSWVKPGNGSEDYTLARMAKELDDQTATLAELGQPRPFTFAYPCGETTVGDGHESYVPLVRARFLAARGVAGSLAGKGVDRFLVPAVFSTGSGPELVGRVKDAVAQGGWLVFGFHGVGGDYLSVSREAHEALLAYLASHRDSVVTAPFGTLAACMAGGDR
jgi:peptidoglycan/xylan/chitin deacetylase (PgdA/CDA1 family)